MFIPIGKIIGAHGIKGNLKVHSYAESLSPFETGTMIRVKNARSQEKNYLIKWVKPHSKGILLALEDIDDRSQAEALIGAELFIPQSELPDLDDDTYYWFELIGMEVYSTKDEYLGRIDSIFPTGSNDVYVVTPVEGKNSREILIPALAWVLKEIDLDKKIMRVDLPEGL